MSDPKGKDVASEIVAPEIVTKKIAEIKPYWRNPRKNNNTILALQKSIERYGFNVPLVIDKDNVLVAGHARYKALRRMGVQEVPCIVSLLSNKKHKEFRILDNRIHEDTLWDVPVLENELKEMFSGTDLATFFEGTLDLVIDIDGLTEDSAADIDLDAKKPEPEPEPESELHAANLCPFCGVVVTPEDIIG